MGRGSIASGAYPLADDVLLPAGSVVTQLVSGAGSYDGATCVRRMVGAPVCWGLNEGSQLGSAGSSVRTPIVVEPTLFAMTSSLAMGTSTLFVTYDNASFGPRTAGTGANVQGQLGVGTSGSVSPIPNDLRSPSGPLSPPPVQIASGRYMTCAILTTGVVTCWGLPNFGVFGVPGTAARTTVDGSLAVPSVP